MVWQLIITSIFVAVVQYCAYSIGYKYGKIKGMLELKDAIMKKLEELEKQNRRKA